MAMPGEEATALEEPLDVDPAKAVALEVIDDHREHREGEHGSEKVVSLLARRGGHREAFRPEYGNEHEAAVQQHQTRDAEQDEQAGDEPVDDALCHRESLDDHTAAPALDFDASPHQVEEDNDPEHPEQHPGTDGHQLLHAELAPVLAGLVDERRASTPRT